MLHQVFLQTNEPGIKRPPGIAGILRNRKISGELRQLLQPLTMRIMLMTHHQHRQLRLARLIVAQQGKEDLLLFLQMAQQILVHADKMLDQPGRMIGTLTMRFFNLPRQTDQFGQLLAAL